MRASRSGIAIGLLFALVAVPAGAQSPEPSPAPAGEPVVPATPSAETSTESVVLVPFLASEVAGALLDTVNGKHPKAKYDAASKDILRYYREHPEAVFAPKRYANEYAPRRVFPACGSKRGAAREDACAAAAYALFYAYLKTRDEAVLGLIDRFLGATSRFIPKKVDKQRVSGLAPIAINENAELLRVPVNLPPVTDEEHVAVVLVDPGAFPKQFARNVGQVNKLLDLEMPKRSGTLPAILLPDTTLVDASQAMAFLGQGTTAIGITDAAVAAELFGEPAASPEPLVGPSSGPTTAPSAPPQTDA